MNPASLSDLLRERIKRDVLREYPYLHEESEGLEHRIESRLEELAWDLYDAVAERAGWGLE